MTFLLHLEVWLTHFLSFFEECKDVGEGVLGPGKARDPMTDPTTARKPALKFDS